jgi:hypothetical protein
MNPSNILFRACVVVLTIVSVLTLPWWVPMTAVLVSAFYFKWFAEGVVVGCLIDLLYSSSGQTILGVHHTFLVASIAIVAASIVLRSVLKFY